MTMRCSLVWSALAVCAVTGLASSARADDAACIAASENEVALRKAYKLRDAMKELAACANPSCPAEIRTECSRRLVEVGAALPSIVLAATDAAGNDLSAVTVTIDGKPLATSLDGHPIQVDPGNHTLRFETAGKAPIDRTVVISEGVKDRHIAVVFGASASALVPVAPVGVVVPVTPVANEPPMTPTSTEGGGTRTVGYVVGSVGVAGLVVGGIFGGLTLSKASSAKNECSPSCAANTNPAAHNDNATASTDGAVSTAAFIAGGALLATGAVLVLVGGPKKTTTGLRWAPLTVAKGSGGGLMLAGDW